MQNAAKQFIDDAIEYDELYGVAEEQPRLTVARRTSALSVMGRIRLLLCAAMLVAVVSLVIYTNVATVELGDRLTRQSATLQELKQEGERLQARRDSVLSLVQVQERASSQMLMGVEESDQVTYISLGEGDVVTRTTKTPDQLPAKRIMETLVKLQEYMKNR